MGLMSASGSESLVSYLKTFFSHHIVCFSSHISVLNTHTGTHQCYNNMCLYPVSDLPPEN